MPNAVERMSDAVDRAPKGMDKRRLSALLRNSAGDVNYRSTLTHLTDEELTYCADHEYRKSGLDQIVREMKRRLDAKRKVRHG